MDDFAVHLTTTDTKKKLSVGQEIIDYLSQPDNSIDCEDLGSFIDALVPWMQSSNFKVSQNGLDVVGLLIESLGRGFRPYINTVLGPAVDRLGDTRETVRDKAHHLITTLMEQEVIEPQALFEKMQNQAFSHKNGKVREEILILMQNTLNVYGAQSLIVSRFLHHIVALYSDPTAPVRDAAASTLVEIYRHIGDRVRVDLQKKHHIPPAKISVLMSKFDAMRASGDMMPTAMGTAANDGNTTGDQDETDRLSNKSKSHSRSSSVPAGARRHTFQVPKPPSDGRSSVTSTSSVRRNPSMRVGSSSGQAGAMDEDSFIQAFEDVKKLSIFNGRDVTQELTKIKETLTKTSNDWKVRMETCAHMRSLLIAGANQYDELFMGLKTLEVAFQVSVKDLRSQVVREACITVAYMSQVLRLKVDRFLEALMQNIINLIPNSAKVMSTSGIVAMRFIIQNTHSQRFLPIICSNINSKSRDIRRHCCEFLDQLLHTWPTATLERHLTILQEAIKKGIADADPDARSFARKAYWGFADHFKDQADVLLNSLEGVHRRMLQAGEMSNSSSSNSLNMSSGTRPSTMLTMPRSRQSSVTSSQENLLDRVDSRSKNSTLTRKNSGIPMFTSPPKTADAASLTNGSPRHSQSPLTARSNSAIDPSAVRRANVRAQYAQRSRLGVVGASLPRPGRENSGTPVVTPDSARSGRSRSRISGGAMGGGSSGALSQPGSRSTSPSSIKSYHTYFDAAGQAPVSKSSPRKRSDPRGSAFEDGSDESETSSINSEKSFDYGRRTSDYGVWTDSRERLHWDPTSQDIGEIIANCASTHWADRKDGLMGLQMYFRDARLLSAAELGRVTEIFTRMFSDAHTKVFALFLETLTELVLSHKADLGEWLYILLTRLLNKLGADLLGSIIQKVNKTLDVVRDSFTYGEQTSAIFKFLVDQTQTPNSKVKVATMNYLRTLTQLMEPSEVLTLSNLSSAEQEMALGKIITWTYEPKSAEVRKAAMASLVSLFRLNANHFSMILHRLPKVYQDNAADLVSDFIMSASSTTLTESTSEMPMKPINTQQSMAENLTSHLSKRRDSKENNNESKDPVDDSENLNPEEVHKSLRSTANAIQNYSFEAKTDDLPSLADKMSLLDIGSTSNNAIKIPIERSNGSAPMVTKIPIERVDKVDDGSRKQMQDIVDELQNVKTNTRSTERRACMTQLIRMAREGNAVVIKEKFRDVLRLLLENLSDEVGATRAMVFGALTEMLKQESLISSFQGFTELIILKVLEAHRDDEKDVERAAEACAAAMAGVVPSDAVIRVLNPIVKTGEYPVNQAAVKMLTKVAENKESMDVVISHLADIMPGLLRAYDNVESSVRKASVFCMVALHQLVGDQMQPHLSSLNGSKLKLLNLYIKRAEAQSTPASPRLTPP